MRINKFNNRKINFKQRGHFENCTAPWSVFFIAFIIRLPNYKGGTSDLTFWAATIPILYLHYHNTFKQWGVEIYNLHEAMCSSTWKGKQYRVAERWRVFKPEDSVIDLSFSGTRGFQQDRHQQKKDFDLFHTWFLPVPADSPARRH